MSKTNSIKQPNSTSSYNLLPINISLSLKIRITIINAEIESEYCTLNISVI
ncbi:hypothetical protein THF1C08_200052 [Vibrio jasicida]|uniref:Uncharacterized protein n=1 Tax=Vibrio jasicida TaxID=766224 RepID=A0AAU9QMN7_9VIBR|nr:hypothetical protein THF1C08_200052 [Vibrio jasicida]CAH1589577.1 hypothetical protein THF1A12_210061 [Vibrio jasicida]